MGETVSAEHSESLLVVNDLRVTVDSGGKSVEVVRGVSLQLSVGEVLGIVGESGSGKTMTVSAIPRLLPSGAKVTGGTVWFKGENLLGVSRKRLSEVRGKEISMVFQDSLTSLNPVMRVGPQVTEPLLLHRIAKRRAATLSAEEGLRRLDIPDPGRAMTRYAHEFSGGMRQRAIIATALIASPSLVIADEPTTALDATVQAQILDVLGRLNRELGVAVILISHDLAVVSEVCKTLAVMYAGRFVEVGLTRDLLARPGHPYTRALLQSMPSPTMAKTRRLAAIPGEPPPIGALPTGCPFHPRCPHAADICRSAEPPLEAVGNSLVACWFAKDGSLPAAPKEQATSSLQVGGQRAQEPAGAAPPDASEVMLSVEHITRHFLIPSQLPFFPPGHVHALDDVSLVVHQGQVLGVAGESGCGKTTLGRCVLRLLDVDSGTISFLGRDITRIGGEDLRQLRRYMQPVFQDPYASLNPRSPVEEIVGEPLAAYGVSHEERKRRVREVLDFVGLGPRFDASLPHQLSGGQRQRVGIARAIALNPRLIVADEPISALDVSVQAQIINLLKDMQREFHLALIFISHDLRVVRHLSTHVAIMFLGQIVEYGPSEDVCSQPLHPYTAALLSSVPSVAGGASRERIVLRGDPPSPSAPPSGCRFRTRCRFAQAVCAEIAPELQAVQVGRTVACHFPLSGRE
jgi:peptide/nickel transport system ATP-binding protein